ncbi:MAG: amidase [Acidimicrobiaceae bacterium]|nr:amidase [Acidimicrobiaceae bacterium]
MTGADAASTPTDSDISDAAQLWGVPSHLLDELAEVADEMLELYQRVRDLAVCEGTAPDQPEPERADLEEVLGRDAGSAWMFRTPQQGPSSGSNGPLSGQRLAVKDCIAVSGVPMTIGTTFFRHVASSDAPSVARSLEAGATLTGTTVCESLCLSGSSFTSSTGVVPNPFDTTRSAGGSSSGNAVVIARGEADIALGTDLGGSVRNPAAWSGITALKPTFGVVPYTGAMPTEATMDHLGLMARTAAEIHPFLVALAGADGFDSRQIGIGSLRPATNTNPRIAVLAEGFEHPHADVRVSAAVRRGAAQLGALLAYSAVAEVSVPLHRHAPDIHAPIAAEGSLVTLFEQSLQSSNHAGPYDSALAEAFASAVRDNAGALPLNAMATLVATSAARRRTGGTVPSIAQGLRRRLQAQYEAVLQQHDVLVLPTVPMLPHLLPRESLSVREYRRLAFEMHDNNCATNLTGHPSITIPCAMIDGLPVGMMLIGRHLEDLDLIALAARFQQECFAPPQPSIE